MLNIIHSLSRLTFFLNLNLLRFFYIIFFLPGGGTYVCAIVVAFVHADVRGGHLRNPKRQGKIDKIEAKINTSNMFPRRQRSSEIVKNTFGTYRRVQAVYNN